MDRMFCPSDKWRAVAYSLCGPCASLPDRIARVEEWVLADFDRTAGIAADRN
jgi:hypothetical protein